MESPGAIVPLCPHCDAVCSRAWEDGRGVVWRCKGPDHHVFRINKPVAWKGE